MVKNRSFYMVPCREENNYFFVEIEVAQKEAFLRKQGIFYRISIECLKPEFLNFKSSLETLGFLWVEPLLDSLNKNIPAVNIERCIGYFDKRN